MRVLTRPLPASRDHGLLIAIILILALVPLGGYVALSQLRIGHAAPSLNDGSQQARRSAAAFATAQAITPTVEPSATPTEPASLIDIGDVAPPTTPSPVASVTETPAPRTVEPSPTPETRAIPTRSVLPSASATAQPTSTPASPTARLSATGATENQQHVVQPGETLFSIARQSGVSLDALAAANGLAVDATIYAGETLTVTTTGYTVLPGDTLGAIAARFGVSQAALVDANGLTDAGSITAGQRLVIPSAR
ncbi:MAG: hypothetical protein QOF51_594 [Chloroflexota bacterium]|nr:hypothetical protein [Chloroflexota bacterium]